MNQQFINAIRKRRSHYSLGRNVNLSNDDIRALITDVMKNTPSAFHSQSSRAVILFGNESVEFWRLIELELRKLVPAENFKPTEDKMKSFAAGVGTILFFEDQDVVNQLQEQFPLYAENFPTWSEHANGMAQFSVWTALANANIGASLQHYNPFADATIAKRWNIPSNWLLRAQMPFGSIEGDAQEKTFIQDEERVKVFA